MGGKAFKGGTTRIQREQVGPTLEWLENRWPSYQRNGRPLRFDLLGSGGKNDSSGDLDLNLDEDAYDQAEVARELQVFLGADNVQPRPGNNQIFTSVPIYGSKDRVQIDFMFGDKAWQAFSYYSPRLVPSDVEPGEDSSHYKGLYRTEFIKALVAFNSDWVLEENQEMVARVGPTFFHDRGLVWRYRYRPMRRDGTARIKDFKEVTRDEFMEIFPGAIDAKAHVIKDPKAVTRLILGDERLIYTTKTIENLYLSAWQVYDSSQLKRVCQIYVERLNSLKVEIPDSLRRFISLGVK